MKIKRALVDDYQVITELFEELMKEICEKTNRKLSIPDHYYSLEICKNYLEKDTYIVFLAEEKNHFIGFISLCISHSLYAGGEFGIIQEFYVLPEYRSNGIGSKLLAKAIQYGKTMEWKRIEVATPPLPQFSKSFIFYKNNGFIDGEGRKLKCYV
ncbi:GNAT family N-acetyltransferase [Metabacillus litoralis]|uniref:GNAT family N-acetyltransferase n=1 Tax=Metabacillus litoralis TaxID=152268 RepID=A0A5C6WAI0_9BACI|nr:GNAT family N-acetyltransferase [Metabacillus litoralis]TXC92852.1 GNAT family N-acetyltransferase [Metabacillus litoralis]